MPQPRLSPRQHRQVAIAGDNGNTTEAAAAAAGVLATGRHRAVQVSDGELLQHSMLRWLSAVRDKALLVRVFTAAEAAWQARSHEDALLTLEGGELLSCIPCL
jgi:hypothetical protein